MKLKVTHRKRHHRTNILTNLKIRWALLLGYRKVKVTFTIESQYVLNHQDQLDWNKICGFGSIVTKKGIKKHERVLVWRYNYQNKLFQVSNQYERENYCLKLPTSVKYINEHNPVIFHIADAKGIPSGAWFGGNRKAPKGITYYLEFVK